MVFDSLTPVPFDHRAVGGGGQIGLDGVDRRTRVVVDPDGRRPSYAPQTLLLVRRAEHQVAEGGAVVLPCGVQLPCPSGAEATAAGLALDPNNPAGAANYGINASPRAYDASLRPIGHNIRISLHTWDPQLNSMKPSGINAFEGFIGDFFGVIAANGNVYTTSVTAYDGGTNPGHFQQQVVATVSMP